MFTPLKAVRKNCLDCMGGSANAVKECNLDCPLHIYRFGHNPRRKGVGNRFAFAKKARAKSADCLSASVANVNASVAATQINSSTQQMNRKEK